MKIYVLEHLCHSSVLVWIHCVNVLFLSYCIPIPCVVPIMIFYIYVCNLCDSFKKKCTFIFQSAVCKYSDY